MKVLITGASGNLGRVLAPALVEAGHEPVMMDNRTVETSHRFIKGDITNKEDVFHAVKGVDAIVHAAALHGIHLSKYSRDDFWKLNVEGTYNVFEAAKEHGIKKVLLCSTMGVYGEGIQQPHDDFAVAIEDLPLKPNDFYGQSKKLCEEMAEFYSRRHGIHTIAYRLGMFVPENFIRYGFRLLKGGVDDRDVAQAFLLGLENKKIIFDAFHVFAEVPFPIAKLKEWRKNPKAFLLNQYPDLEALVEKHRGKLDELVDMWGHVYWSIEKTKRLLGYSPEYSFNEFYAALKEDNEAHYPYAGLPWWGV